MHLDDLGREWLHSSRQQRRSHSQVVVGWVQHDQKLIMDGVAGRFMGQGMYAFKKGSTYQWPITHLADAFDEVTPRKFSA